MIKHFTIGTPIDTESVIAEIPCEAAGCDVLESELAGVFGSAQVCAKDKEIRLPLGTDDIVYGLGETVRGMNKRGWLYRSNNSDDPDHLEEKHSLYAAHNFLLITSKERSIGLYVDTPGLVTFDIGYTWLDELRIAFEDFDANLYVITNTPALAERIGSSQSVLPEGGLFGSFPENTQRQEGVCLSSPAPGDCRSIVKQFRGLIGRSYIPPKWAFGLGQSRWSYGNEDEVRDTVEGYRDAGIPLDMIYLDIDYMERYKDFTIDGEAFPDFPEFVQEMKDEGIRIIPIIDAGVKAEDGYDFCEEGLAKDYFCKKEDGTVLTAAVWPGRAYFPDFLKPQVREWFGNAYAFLTDQGIEGFWNDMNEPAIFYTEETLQRVFRELRTYQDQNLDVDSLFAFRDLVNSMANNPDDYRRFYHEYHGQRIRHDKVHNLFGFNMTRAAGEAFVRLRPNERTLMLARSSYIGAHRYGGIWTGDNRSWWSHILLNIQQMPGLNMCGFLYTGADTGGFSADATEDLVMRWLGVSIFTPLLRNHAARGTRRQELTAFGQTVDFRNLIELRYALIPYLTSEFLKAAVNDTMYMEPLSFEWPQDERARNVEDQLLVGDSIMIAPVYTQNAHGRYVYLPEDMLLLRFRSPYSYDTEELPAGDHYVRAELNEIPVFLRRGRSLPLARPAMHVEDIDFEDLTFLSYPLPDGTAAPYEMMRYEDL